MTLSELKSQVDILHIAQELGLRLTKNGKCLCPFHKEKTPSLQFSRAKQIATCFSGNCDAGTMDVIELVKKFYSWELPKVVEWLKPFAGQYDKAAPPTKIQTKNLNTVFTLLESKLGKSNKAREYLKARHLDHKKLEAAFNPGKEYDKLKYCIIFPLKNCHKQTVSLYGRSIYDNAKAKHYYTTNRKGLYPGYPNPETRHLIITESIIDTATLQQYFYLPPAGRTGSKETNILTAYGTNGITSEHREAISSLKKLHEIIFWFDGDSAGREAIEKYTKELQELLPKVTISTVSMLDNEDINSLLDTHEPEIFQHLYDSRETLYKGKEKEVRLKRDANLTINPGHSIYSNAQLKIDILGKIDTKDVSRLKVTLVTYNKEYPHLPPSRNPVDLYNDDQTEKLVRKISDKIQLPGDPILKALDKITRGLEAHRLALQKEAPKTKLRYPLRELTSRDKDKALELLQSDHLTTSLTRLLETTGIVGEEKNALFLFTLLLSHKMHRTLHGVVQGTSGSGKSHLIAKVADCMHDQNKIKRFTRVTDKSFYNYGETDLCNCGIILEDYDGLTEEAELAWRELQSNGKLSSSVSQKNEQTGEITTGEKYVFGPIASLVATTHFRIYEDNESRVFTIAIDESETQTEKVLDYMAKKAAKVVTDHEELEAREAIQNVVYLLKPYKVKNPYRLQLPKTTKQRRRLTQMLHDYIEQVTLLHQFQRQKTDQAMLVTQLKDLEIAVELMFNSIVLKTDELDGILRQFYENLKEYVEDKGKDYQFSQREVRQHFRVSRSQMQRYIKELEELEYIHRSGIGPRNIHKFKISYWDNIEKLRAEIRQYLFAQITTYKDKEVIPVG